jgi:hypothetical protein
MATAWIHELTKKYDQHIVLQRREDEKQLRDEEIARSRANRLAVEGPIVGAELWAALQSVIKHDVAEFNEEFGDVVLRTKALGDGTFEVHFSQHGKPDKIAALTYESDPPKLSWNVFGGAKGTPLTVGLKMVPVGQGVDQLLFTTGNSFPSLEELSQHVISNLLPC